MLTQLSITEFCSKYNYDIRITKNGRWIDQKCAADVVTVIADCILNYNIENPGSFFTTPDIWHYKYAVENIEAIFKKPEVENTSAKNEYDKFFQQPMEMLAYANVLSKEKRGTRNYYKIISTEVLEYIALREKNALFFLKTYIEKVLRDSEIYYIFEEFFEYQTKEKYNQVKLGFSNFTISNTKINGITECNRIFIKVINPLAYFKNSLGTERGRISKHHITYDMLMYNRNNFRDINSEKPKDMTRTEYTTIHPVEFNEAYFRYQSSKAKRFLKLFNDQHRRGKTEHLDGIHINDQASHIHHIFPESEYLEICYLIENLIALTPTQHLNYAHPNGNTQEIDEQFQHLLLLSKSDRIYENLTNFDLEKIYEFENFLLVLSVGFDNDGILEIENMDFNSVILTINNQYVA